MVRKFSIKRKAVQKVEFCAKKLQYRLLGPLTRMKVRIYKTCAPRGQAIIFMMSYSRDLPDREIGSFLLVKNLIKTST